MDENASWWQPPDETLRTYPKMPPDPRRVCPVKAGELRDLFTTGWSGDGADFAILRALFAARINGGEIAVPCWRKVQDTDARRQPLGPPRFYVTTAFVNRQLYTRSLDASLHLLGRVLPGAGYTLRQAPRGRPEAWLIRGDSPGPAHGGRSPELALLAALFDELTRDPEAATARREP